MDIYKKNNLVLFCNSQWVSLIIKEAIPKNNFKNIIIITDKNHKIAKHNKIKIISTNTITLQFLKKNIDVSNSLILSFGSPWIFSDKIIKLFKNKLLNVHQSPLPKYKGSVASYVILYGIKALQSWIHVVTNDFDSGDLIYSKNIFINKNLHNPLEVNNHIQQENRVMIKNFLNDYTNNKKFTFFKQNKFFTSYLPRLNSNVNGWIDWSLSVYEIDRFIRSFDNPYDGSKTMLNGNEVTIRDIEYSLEDSSLHSFSNGMILRKFNNYLVVSVKFGSIYIKDIKYKNKDIIKKVKLGDKFYTPKKYLDMSNGRVLYSKNNNMIFNKNFKIKNEI